MKHNSVDIVVIGGGVSGFAAAISAAQKRKKAVVIERENTLGGNAIQSNVGTICGAFYRSKSESFFPINHPFLHYFLSALNAEPINYHNGLVVVPYNVSALEKWMQQELKNHGVEVLVATKTQAVAQSKNNITEVLCEEKNGSQISFHPTAVIDCSGNAAVSKHLKIETISSETYQRAAQVFQVKNCSSANEFALNFALKKEITLAVKSKLFPADFTSLSVVPGSLQKNIVDLKFTLPETITDAISQSDLNQKGEKYVQEIFAFLQNRLASFKTSEISKIYPQAGIRVRQRSLGKYVLTQDDVLGMKKHAQSAAHGTWPIEIWEANGQVNMTYFNEKDYFDISEDCLISNQIENLFFAGKNISATPAAIASARVIGTCLQTGFAAGNLADKWVNSALKK